MALISCPECKHQISEHATSCPQCGYKLAEPEEVEVIRRSPSLSDSEMHVRGKVFTLLGFLVVAFLGVGFFANVMTAPSQSPQYKPTETRTQPELLGKIGDSANVGHFVFKVDDIKFVKALGDGAFQKKADGIYLLIKVDIENRDKETRTLDSSMFELLNSNGVMYESSVEGTTAYEMAGYEYGSIFLKGCQPNIKTVGVLVFEVPTKKDNYQLKLSGGYGTGKYGLIALKK